MQTFVQVGFAFAMGMIMSIYLPMNSSVSRHLGSPLTATITFFLAALLTALLVFMFCGRIESLQKIRDVPAYLYLSGFISAFVVLGTTHLIPYLGARRFFILLLSGQIVMAIIVSHLGILESPKDPVSIKKITGASLVILGAWVSTS